MTRLLPFDPIQRRLETAPGTSLGALADALSRELEPLHAADQLPIPEGKAQLTRHGGRCPAHGVYLHFDPWQPHRHRCPRCHQVFEGQAHDDWWAMGAQLWAAERAVHAAALHLLRGDPRDAALSQRILGTLATRYLHWPNQDNALGPTRPFFSTYLESIWLLNLCHALDLLETAGQVDRHDVRGRILAPSSALIASFHEGHSNRQVWNEVAILSAWTMLGARQQVEDRLDGVRSLPALLDHGLLPDGTWYEGENYHLFAHRGLWYGVQLMAALGRPLTGERERRFHEGFTTPFIGLLPDETLPSRRDSQYRVSVRQWRFAEWCELGYAYRPDARLAGLLTTLYDGSVVATSDARARSMADAERNEGPARLTRADCSWRALLMGNTAPVPAATWRPTSGVLPSQGLAVLRRESGRVYLALEGGATGGGHGHPDRLALTVQADGQRWLDDPGTGSYVDRTLHWYRSTLAHQAPLVDGASQRPAPAQLTAYEERGGAGWIRKAAQGVAPGVDMERTIVALDGYLVDITEWHADRSVTVTLPICGTAVTDASASWRTVSRPGAGGLEDGFDFVTDIAATDISPTAPGTCPTVVLDCDAPHTPGPRMLRAWAGVRHASALTLLRGTAPGAPGEAPGPRHWMEATGARGAFVTVWSWSGAGRHPMVEEVHLPAEGDVIAQVTTREGTTATHGPAPHGWHIGLTVGPARSSIDLEGVQPLPVLDEVGDDPSTMAAELADEGLQLTAEGIDWVLGAAHYRQTEEPWGGSNAPTATVRLAYRDDRLVLELSVQTGHVAVTASGTADEPMPENPWDNERSDINADGVQLYLGTAGGPWRLAYLIAPLSNGEARVTPLLPATGPLPAVRWNNLADATGYAMQVALPMSLVREPLDGASLSFDLIVNERPPHRQRRRGQLVLSGGGGFGYLRGDRQDPSAALRIDGPADPGA